eukprot:2555942-Prorocentrum_lima.AAC.1
MFQSVATICTGVAEQMKKSICETSSSLLHPHLDVCLWVHVVVVAPTAPIDFEFEALAVAPVSVPIQEGEGRSKARRGGA